MPALRISRIFIFLKQRGSTNIIKLKTEKVSHNEKKKKKELIRFILFEVIEKK